MIPTWFPWIFVGGVVFIILSFLGTKYKDKQYKNIQFFQDFISGAILIAFAGVLVPDFFPKMELPMIHLPLNMKGSGDMMGDNADFELQVGPPRLAGR